ncbi:(Fe-S)-binding protein [Microbispora sp. H11081]|uniref:(Fe-S)-binding protein n=1 Tax=Microbispora sp. H11081 TaxID=2729107 RepID=UPI001473E59C|nr:(Fe-S)-binding protein [Microbispora sp. H11081]
MRVALFVTCVNDTLFPDTGRAVVRLLRRLGVEADFPHAQTCCGQMHANTGYRDEAVRLAKRGVAALRGYDAVVVPSGSCAAMIREQYPRLAGPRGPFADAVARVVPRTYELTEFLVDVLGVTDVGAYFPHRVTYHPTCHSLRGLHLGDRPLTLLRAVKGLELVPLPGAEECCGFGGTFALKNADVSAAMCADKARAVLGTGAEVLCAADNSCLMHIGGMLGRQKSGVRVMHLAEILCATETAGVR